MTSTMRRRDVLRGIGAGAALLSPSLRAARARAAAPAGNFLVFFTPNGFHYPNFGATAAGTAFTFKSSLAPLERHRKNVTVIRGLCNKSTGAWTSHETMTKILTCVYPKDVASKVGDRGTYNGYGPSLDHVLAAHFGQAPLTLGLPSKSAWNTLLSWKKSLVHDPHIPTPTEAFKAAFDGAVVPAADPQALEAARRRNRSLLDFVRQDIGLLSSRLGADERRKLDQDLEALREVEQKVMGRVSAGGASCDKDAVSAAAAAAGTDLKSRGDAMIDIATAAFACGTRNVATMLWQPESAGSNPLGGTNHHSISHAEVSTWATDWPKIDAWYAERFAYTLDRLSKLGILDRTIVVWLSGQGAGHWQADMYQVVAGGDALGMKLGQSLVYPHAGSKTDGDAVRASSNTSVADLWVAVMRALGMRADSFGDAGYCSGPLRELHAG